MQDAAHGGLLEKQYSRRKVLKAALVSSVLASSAGLLAACETDADDDVDDVDPVDDDADDDVVDPDDDDDEPVDEEDDDDRPAGASMTGDDPDRMGGTLRFGFAMDATTLGTITPSVSPSPTIFDQIYESLTLMNLDPDATDDDPDVFPGLAHSWEVADDDVTWTFHLREGVTFHTGNSFDAHAITYVLDEILNPDDPGSNYTWFDETLDSYEALDDYTYQFVTSEPYPLFTRAIQHPVWLMIPDPEHHREIGEEEFGRNPSGTGPFKFEEWVRDERIVLTAYEDYWDGRPYLDQVEFHVIPDASSRVAALEADEVDAIHEVPGEMVSIINDNPDLEMLTATGMRQINLLFNFDNPPTDELEVRLAVCHAVDVESLVTAVQGLDVVSLPQGYIPAEVEGYLDVGLYPFDPEEAGRILDEAGWVMGDDGVRERNGERLEINAWANDRFPNDAQIIEGVAAYLTDIGFDVDVDFFEWAAWLENVTTFEEHNLITYGMGNSLRDSEWYFSGAITTIARSDNPVGGRNNHSGDAPGDIDERMEAAGQTLDRDERLEHFHAIQETMHEYAYWLPLYIPYEAYAIQSRVQDLTIASAELMRIGRTWLSED